MGGGGARRGTRGRPSHAAITAYATARALPAGQARSALFRSSFGGRLFGLFIVFVVSVVVSVAVVIFVAWVVVGFVVRSVVVKLVVFVVFVVASWGQNCAFRVVDKGLMAHASICPGWISRRVRVTVGVLKQ